MRLPPVSHCATGAQCVPFSLQNLPREQSVHVADGLCMEPVAPAPLRQKAPIKQEKTRKDKWVEWPGYTDHTFLRDPIFVPLGSPDDLGKPLESCDANRKMGWCHGSP